MFIYKITNLQNNKIYIGQTSKSIEFRFNLHIRNSKKESYRIKQPVDMAIYKYGVDNFEIKLIDIAHDKKELSSKERFWISFYNSTDNIIGYKITDGGEGGNTYQFKSKKDMDKIKKTISIKNTGRTNGMARPIKLINDITGEVKILDTVRETKEFFNIRGVFSILSRCRGYKKPYKGWWISYEDENYHNYSN